MNKKDFIYFCSNAISKNNMHHAIIINSSDQNVLDWCALEFERVLFCENHSPIFDDCNWCKKIISKNNLNSETISGEGSTISKDDIKKIIYKYSRSSFENNISKIYIIKNGDFLKETSSNTLLKFLEEPPKNTYCVILVKDIVKILDTIKSRCLIYKVQPEDLDINIKDDLSKFYIEKNKIKLFDYFINLKKEKKEEIVNSLEANFQKFMVINLKLAESILLCLNEVKKQNYFNLSIENLLIDFMREIEC
ncbi:DNA polymerase III subunit delta' [Spiroplasma litorale]|uniref:DNA polymerase III subunit delta n=1 Tax=Spiroplasma litorale TaxID=216942 RepID=A0A0K1W0P3_9MOLU|nr:hypothetical protein [Spiroplasma litorale]AKX33677.1 DNA polymerase III subunit delta' [Spiroplasma litorale]